MQRTLGSSIDDPDGRGVDLTAEFRKLGLQQRQDADCHSLAIGVIPIAFKLVRLSLDDKADAAAVGQRVASMCRQLASDESGYGDLWLAVADLIGMSSVSQLNPRKVIDRIREFDSDKVASVHALGYILATWHMPPEGTLYCQLSCIEWLHGWYPPTDRIHQKLLLPYIESYWLHVARNCRYALGSPAATAEAIETAAQAPANGRVRAILLAAASGLRVRGLEAAFRWLRGSVT